MRPFLRSVSILGLLALGATSCQTDTEPRPRDVTVTAASPRTRIPVGQGVVVEVTARNTSPDTVWVPGSFPAALEVRDAAGRVVAFGRFQIVTLSALRHPARTFGRIDSTGQPERATPNHSNARGTPMPPTIGHGKICYLILPAVDVEASAAFYEKVFGWNIRRRGNGDVAFDDAVGQVSGMWLRGGAPVDAGFVHIMTDDAERTCRMVAEEGGQVVERPDPSAREITAQFRDPAGNLFALYQDPSLARRG